MLYYLLCRKFPFEGESETDVFNAIKKCDFKFYGEEWA